MNSGEQQLTVDSSGNPHVVTDQDYKNVVSLLWMFARQLGMTLEESQHDYQTVLDYCLAAESGTPSSAESVTKDTVLTALQYRDRYVQRTQHVKKRLTELADYFHREDWAGIAEELQLEIELSKSFYSDVQAMEFSSLADGYCELNTGQQAVKHRGQAHGDMDFFDG